MDKAEILDRLKNLAIYVVSINEKYKYKLIENNIHGDLVKLSDIEAIINELEGRS